MESNGRDWVLTVKDWTAAIVLTTAEHREVSEHLYETPSITL